MGLFGNKDRLKDTLAQILSESSILPYIIAELERVFQNSEENEEDSYWTAHALGYYDNRERSVIVHKNAIELVNTSSENISSLSEAFLSAERAVKYSCITGRSVEKAQRLQNQASNAADQFENAEQICIPYTSFGYTPLPAYQDFNGKILLDQETVVSVWGNVLHDKFDEHFKSLVFGIPFVTTLASDKVVVIPYYVPELYWRNWF